MKKRIIVMIVFVLFLVCIGGVIRMSKSNSSMIGQKVIDIRKKCKNSIVMDVNCLLICKNDDGYVLNLTNNETIIAEAIYNKAGMIIAQDGFAPLRADVFDHGTPQTVQDMEEIFGYPHIDVGSGAYLPTYILDDGRIVTYRVNNDEIVGVIIKQILDI